MRAGTTHLASLESESIHIIREVVAEPADAICPRQCSTGTITSLRRMNQSVQGGSYWASVTGPLARK